MTLLFQKIKQFWWVAILAGLAVWAGALAYSTFFPPKTEYEQKIDAIAELIGGVQAANLEDAREILEKVNYLVRRPGADEREYFLIRNWLVDFFNGNPTPEDKNKIIQMHKAQSGPEITWNDIEEDAIERANIILGRPPTDKVKNLNDAADELKKKMADIEKINDSSFNLRLDEFRRQLANTEAAAMQFPDILKDINNFLAKEVPDAAEKSTLLSETIVVPYLVNMLDDENATLRKRLYNVIVRVVALSGSEDITAVDPTEQEIEKVKALFNYDPDAQSESRRAAMQRIREWLNTGDNKRIYRP